MWYREGQRRGKEDYHLSSVWTIWTAAQSRGETQCPLSWWQHQPLPSWAHMRWIGLAHMRWIGFFRLNEQESDSLHDCTFSRESFLMHWERTSDSILLEFRWVCQEGSSHGTQAAGTGPDELNLSAALFPQLSKDNGIMRIKLQMKNRQHRACHGVGIPKMFALNQWFRWFQKGNVKIRTGI